ncbi:MAG: hypothetical protein PF483_05660 [Halothiobacillus sp.]|jgi:dTDP-4-dehydrorhamnose 3,5-epimerase-like enzyme|nr:hypothetical protein [Halothiobacillus sp.]
MLNDQIDILVRTQINGAPDFYAPDYEATLAIDWPVVGEPLVSAKDEQAASFRNAGCLD